MEKLGVQTSVPMTCMQWDTLFSRISNTIDNLPIALGDTSNETLWVMKLLLLIDLNWEEITIDLLKVAST